MMILRSPLTTILLTVIHHLLLTITTILLMLLSMVLLLALMIVLMVRRHSSYSYYSSYVIYSRTLRIVSVMTLILNIRLTLICVSLLLVFGNKLCRALLA